MNSNPAKKPTRQYILRLPESLYTEVRDEAAEEGISLNTWIACVLAGAVSFRKPEAQ